MDLRVNNGVALINWCDRLRKPLSGPVPRYASSNRIHCKMSQSSPGNLPVRTSRLRMRRLVTFGWTYPSNDNHLAVIQADQPWKEDFSEADLYSQKELRSKVVFPAGSTLQAVTSRNCLADSKCEEECSIPLYNMDMLAPRAINPLRFCARFRMGRVFGLMLHTDLCVLFRGRLFTVVAVAVKAGPTVAMTVGRHLYDSHRQLYRTTVKQHKT